MSKGYDVAIVGGGLAGASAAIRLRQAGKTVVLIEKEKAAHHKVCGEFLSHEAVENLQELGIDLKDPDVVTIENTRLIKGGKIVSAPLSFYAQSLPRYVLDEALIDKAIKEGTVVKRGITITDMRLLAGSWCVSGKKFEVCVKDLFLATGKHDIRGWQRAEGAKNDYIGFKMHYDLSPNHASLQVGNTDVILFKGGYAGFQMVGESKANLCLVVEKKRFAAFDKKWNFLLEDLCNQTPYLAKILKGAQPCWDKPIAIFGIPYGYVYNNKELPPHFYRLGDQMAVIPSFAGGGMAIALCTAKLAVDCYLNTDADDYHQKAQSMLKLHIWKSTGLGMLIASSRCQNLLMLLSRAYPKILTVTAKYTRLHRA